MGRDGRRSTRRAARATRTTAGAEVGTGGRAASTGGLASSGAGHIQVRSDRVIERESQGMLDEMKRVLVVSGVCFGMLAVLVIVDRMA